MRPKQKLICIINDARNMMLSPLRFVIKKKMLEIYFVFHFKRQVKMIKLI